MAETEKKCVRCGASFIPDRPLNELCPECDPKTSSVILGEELLKKLASVQQLPKKGSSVARPPLREEAGAEEGEAAAGGPAVVGPAKRSAIGSKGVKAPEPSAKADISVGTLFGNYEILDEVSQGAFGVVYRAQQRGLNRIVALKVLLAGASAGEEAVARFLREARAVARLKHPNIVPIYDIGEERGHHYFAMEFIEGESLGKRLVRGPAPPAEALGIIEKMADAIETAHQVGIIHRDIKPSNIMLETSGVPHITDFGLAKQVGVDSQHTATGTTLGTPSYMPPEQARGEVDRIDARSDVYSLGAVLYEMMVGKAPFSGRSLLEVVIAVINETPAPPRSVNPRIHRDIQTIVLKCLEKDPRNRYQTAAELRDDIRRYLNGEAIRARPVGSIVQGFRFLRANRVTVCAFLLALAGLVTAYVRTRQLEATRKKSDEQIKAMEKMEVEESRPQWRSMLTYEFPRDLRTGEWLKETTKEIYTSPQRLDATVQQIRCRQNLFGDIRTLVEFTVSDSADAKAIVRFGLRGDQGTFYVLTVGAGRMVLAAVSPIDREFAPNENELVAWTLAEKEGPSLLPGDYSLMMFRQGMRLDFRLVCSGNREAALSLWSPELTHWRMKNVYLVFRETAMEGVVQVRRIRVDRLLSPTRADAMTLARATFMHGDYNGALPELERLRKESPIAATRLEAVFLLAIDQELQGLRGRSRPADADRLRAAGRLYRDLLADATRGARGGKEAGKDADGGKDSEKCRTAELVGDARLRLFFVLSAVGEYDEAQKYLLQYLEAGDSLPEDCAWHLLGPTGPLELALNAKPQKKLDLCRTIVAFSGVPPGCGEFGRHVQRLGADLIAAQRPDLVMDLHRKYPCPQLAAVFQAALTAMVNEQRFEDALDMFSVAVSTYGQLENRAKWTEKATEIADALIAADRGVEVIGLYARYPDEALGAKFASAVVAAAKGQRFDEAMGLLNASVRSFLPAKRSELLNAAKELCRRLVRAGQGKRIEEVHDAMPDDGLAEAFADGIRTVYSLQPGNDEALLGMLRSAAKRFKGQKERALIDSAVAAVSAQSAVTQDEAYMRLLRIYEAYPLPSHTRQISGVFDHLFSQKMVVPFMAFYAAARPVLRPFPQDVQAMAVYVAEDLHASGADPFWFIGNVAGQFADDRQRQAEWQMELGDLKLRVRKAEEAEVLYGSAMRSEHVDSTLRARAGLRAGMLALMKDDAAEFNERIAPALRTLCGANDIDAEIRLAVLYLIGDKPADEIYGERTGLAQRTVSDPEWDVLFGLRLHKGGHAAEARRKFFEARNACEKSRRWPAHILPALMDLPQKSGE